MKYTVTYRHWNPVICGGWGGSMVITRPRRLTDAGIQKIVRRQVPGAIVTHVEAEGLERDANRKGE